MKKFRFRLETVLDVRSRRVEKEQEEYHRLVEEARTVESRMERILRARRQVLEDTEAQMKDRVDLENLRRSLDYADFLKNKLALLEREMLDAEKRRLAQRSKLTEALRQKQVMQKLRDKALDAFNASIAIEEQRHLDEWSVTRRPERDHVSG